MNRVPSFRVDQLPSLICNNPSSSPYNNEYPIAKSETSVPSTYDFKGLSWHKPGASVRACFNRSNATWCHVFQTIGRFFRLSPSSCLNSDARGAAIWLNPLTILDLLSGTLHFSRKRGLKAGSSVPKNGARKMVCIYVKLPKVSVFVEFWGTRDE